ncbi:MAG TPA: carbamoyltransferase HypF, partial [Methanomassiliicoccales archaeon]|nr:carbamoyltransferase HypF [Methanomassiliicoccales archaeon]
LQEIPLLGGEKAVYDVRRLVYAIERHLGRQGSYFNAEERALFDKMLPKSTGSTSLGRLMDATACALEVCQHRSYDGEPAMKLERWLSEGRVDRSLVCQRKGDTLLDLDLFEVVLDARTGKKDVAASYIHSVLQGLMDMAMDRAEDNGQRSIGLTGGVSYNFMICHWAGRMAKARGMELVLPRELPNGDGCISAGQCAIAAASMR